MLPNPWRLLRALPQVTLQWHDGGDAGWYDFATDTISLRRGMCQAERRSTLRHELEHHARGPVLPHMVEAEEDACELAAARDLIDLRHLGETLAWTQDVDDVAEELWVDQNLVEMRIACLHSFEWSYLQRRLAHLADDTETEWRIA